MQYSLEYSNTSDHLHGTKDLGENVLFANLPAACRVYAFYYPGDTTNPALETALRKVAADSGQNLFVNIGRLNDPQLYKIVSRFQIEKYPVVIMTADPSLASTPGENVTAYVRLDDERLLKSPERTSEVLLQLLNLFLQGKVAEAVAHAKGRQRAEMGHAVAEFLKGALGKFGSVLHNLELSYSLIEGTISLKASRSGDE